MRTIVTEQTTSLPFLHKLGGQGGYTLIQVAIGLVVLGVLIAPLIGAYNLYRKNQIISQSYERIETLTAALQNFRDIMGAYPCPAPLKAARGIVGSGYGTATNCRTDSSITSLTPGTCDSTRGICVEQAIPSRATTLAGMTPPQNPRVIVGAIPFRSLQLEEEQALDPYGSRLVYAVTESMTDRTAINDMAGAIAVRKADGTPLLTPDGSAAFFLFSPGPTKVGAYAMEGGLIQSCTTTTADGENCNDGFEDGNAPSNASVYVSDVQSLGNNSNFFDDMTGYFSNRFNPLWQRTLSNPEVVEDLSPRAIGIGTAVPSSSSALLQIQGPTTAPASLIVQDLLDPSTTPPTTLPSALWASRICLPGSTQCFQPSVLAGDPTPPAPATPTGGMFCSTGFMVGIANNAPVCEDISFRCPTGKILVKVNADGTFECGNVPLPACPATTRSECGVNISLALGADGAQSPWSGYLNSTLGGCRRVQYSCSSGAWSTSPSSTNGRPCSFTPVTTVTAASLPCSIYPGYTGTYSTTSTTQCLGGAATGSTFATDCTCVGATIPETRPCSDPSVLNNPNMSGTATRTKIYNTPACNVTYSAWDTSACTCNMPPNLTQTISGPSCPPPLSGVTGFTEQTFNTSTCRWETTNSLPGNCTCALGPEITSKDHVCADPVCDKSVVPDTFKRARDPATCLPIGPEIPLTTGSCAPLSFSWTYLEPAEPGASVQVQAGTSCGCTQKTSGATKICDTGTGKAVCECR